VRDHRLQSHDFPLQHTAGPYIEVKRFQTIHDSGVNVARGLLLSGIGALVWGFLSQAGDTFFIVDLDKGQTLKSLPAICDA
jgi:hypothetical protein